MKAPAPLVPHSIEGARVSVTHVTQDSERPVRTFAQSGTRKRIHDHASKSPSSLRRRQGRNDIVGSPGLPRNGEALHHRRQCIENFECSARCYSIRTINLSGGQSLFPTTKGCPARGWRGAACGGRLRFRRKHHSCGGERNQFLVSTVRWSANLPAMSGGEVHRDAMDRINLQIDCPTCGGTGLGIVLKRVTAPYRSGPSVIGSRSRTPIARRFSGRARGGGGGCTRTRYRDLEPDRRIIFDARAWLAAAARFGVRRDFICGTFFFPSKFFEIFVAFCPLSMTMPVAIGSLRPVLRLDEV
jgi:hypothetical protein